MNQAILAHEPPARRAPRPFASRDFLEGCRRRARHVPAGTDLILEGDEVASVLWLLDGWLGQSKTLDDGRAMMMDVALPVDLLRVEGGDGRSAVFGVSALTDCVVANWSRAELARERAAFPQLDGILDHLGAAALARRHERMLRIGQGNAAERVAFLVLELSLRMAGAEPAPGAPHAPIPLSQRRIGELTGLTNVHVCRTLGQLAERGLVELREGRVRLRDAPGLAAVAQADPEALRRAIVV